MAITRPDANQVSFAQAGSGAVERTVQDELRGRVSVKQFGAIADYDTVGGTGTDNTAAFQAAINAVATGGEVVIPAGYYRLAGNLTVPAQIRVVGAGRNSTRLYWSGTGNFISWPLAGPDGSSFQDMWIESTQGQNTGSNTGFKGYTAGSNRHLLFERVFFRAFSFAGCDISDSYNIRFKDCRWAFCGNATTQGGGVKFTHITFAGNDACNGALFDNCYFGSTSYTSVFGDTVSWATFIGTVFESMTYTINLPVCRELTFIGCYAESNTNPGILQDASFINTLRDVEQFTVNGMCWRKSEDSPPSSLSNGAQSAEPTVASGTMNRIRNNQSSSDNCLHSIIAGASGIAGIRFGDVTSERGRVYYSNALDQLQFATAGTNRWNITSTGLYPEGDNASTCGTAPNRISTVYAATGTINTSDARLKTPVRALTAAEIAAARDLSREIGVYQFLDAIATKGDAARLHVGMTVQRAIEIMQAHGLDPFSWGFICYDMWPELIEVRDADGEIIQHARPAGDLYSFRTDELLLFIAAGYEARVSALEDAA